MAGFQVVPPGSRGLPHRHWRLLYEGTIVEFWAALACCSMGKKFREALMKNYNFKVDQTKYFKTHEEADLETLSHFEDNANATREIQSHGTPEAARKRGGLLSSASPEYCALTSVDGFGLYLDGNEKHFEGVRNARRFHDL